MYVEVRGTGNEGLDRALIEFKRQVKKEGLMESLKKYEYYVKPSLKRKRKKMEAIKRKRRDAHEEIRRRKDSRDDS